MPKWIRYVFVGTLLCAVGGLLLAVLVLRSPVFSDLRRSIVADYLSDLIGQELVIENDVKVILGADSHLIVSGATIPSVLVDGVKLAELNVLELDLDMSQAI